MAILLYSLIFTVSEYWFFLVSGDWELFTDSLSWYGSGSGVQYYFDMWIKHHFNWNIQGVDGLLYCT